MNTESTYNIEHGKLAWNITPNKLKQPRLLSYVKSLMYPFNYLYILFLQFKKAKQYQLLITPQVCYLTKLLNDRYDVRRRRIYITDGLDKLPLYIFRADELKPVYLYQQVENKPKPLYTEGEAGVIKDDFVVWVPNQLLANIDRNEMVGLIKAYKLAGVKFKIQTTGR